MGAKDSELMNKLNNEIFKSINEKNFECAINNFFKAIDLSELKNNEENKSLKLAEALSSIDIKLKNSKKVFFPGVDGGYAVMTDIEFESDNSKINDLTDVFILFPDEYGFYNVRGRKAYSPFVIFDKFNTLTENENVSLNENEEENDEEFINIEEEKAINLEKSLLLPGYYLGIFSLVLGYINTSINKDSIDEKIYSFNITMLASKLGTNVFKFITNKLNKSGFYSKIYLKVPIFFESMPLNEIEKFTNPRTVIYPQEKISESMRLPHVSHTGITDLIETPESDKIGLTLHLTNSKNLTYDFSVMKFQHDPIDISNPKDRDILSLASSQLPFIRYSDGARMLMGSKNLKQSVKVTGSEEPYLKTGFELESFGRNALVVYGLYMGLNFEDGIVASNSFAQQMKSEIIEHYDLTFRIHSNQKPSISDKGRVCVYNYKKASIDFTYRIEWKVYPGEKIQFGDVLAVVSSNNYEKDKEYKYEGKYEAVVESIPEFPYVITDGETINNFISEKDSGSIVGKEQEYSLIESRLYLKMFKPLEIGDKIMGRHGNKGTISLILDDNKMPKVKIKEETKTADLILSPLGVVSRMNLGQLYEVHTTMASKECGLENFNEFSPLHTFTDKERNLILKHLILKGSDDYGRFPVTIKKSKFENNKLIFENDTIDRYLTSGYMYMVRLDHCVRDKIHFVSLADEGPCNYQPLKGKSRNGGQRFGEMEFWGLYSYDSKNLLKLFRNKNLHKKMEIKDKQKVQEYLESDPTEVFLDILETMGIKIEEDKHTSSYKIVINEPDNMITGLNKIKEKYSEDSEEFNYAKERFNKLLEIIYSPAASKMTRRKEDSNSMLFMPTLVAFKKNADKFKEMQNHLKTSLNNYSKEYKDDVEKLKYENLPQELKDQIKEYFGFVNSILMYKDAGITNIFEDKESDKPRNGNDIYKNTSAKVILEILTYKQHNSHAYLSKAERTKILFTKDGFLRDKVIGRRLHFSGRTVITPCPQLDIEHVYLPIEFGLEMIKNEKVKKINAGDAKRGDIKERKKIAEQLNDFSLFKNNERMVVLNRQPSLHKHSIQTFYPIFWENYTIGLPINVCEGFNADFDGDTMAVYYPTDQSQPVMNEMQKMKASSTFYKLGDGSLIYSIDQDIVYGKSVEPGSGLKDKSEIKKYVEANILKNQDKEVDEKTLKEGLYNFLTSSLKHATEENLTLSIWEILGNNDEESSMRKIKDTKCRGKDEQYDQLYKTIKVDTNEGKKPLKGNFVLGVAPEDYFNTEYGIVKRARQSLMDKKLHVASAGYFTRKLVEFTGHIMSGELKENECHTITKLTYDGFVCKFVRAFMKKEEFNNPEELIKKIKNKLESLFGGRILSGSLTEINRNNIDELAQKLMKKENIEILSPGVYERNGMFIVPASAYGKDPSTNKTITEGKYIGLTAGQVIGERGTQLSMETFHIGSGGLPMISVSSQIFKKAQACKTFEDFLYNLTFTEKTVSMEYFIKNSGANSFTIEINKKDIDKKSAIKESLQLNRLVVDNINNIKESFEEGKKIFIRIKSEDKEEKESNTVYIEVIDLNLIDKISAKAVHYEILYNFAQYLAAVETINKKEKEITTQIGMTPQEFFSSVEKRGLLSVLSFEKGFKVLSDVIEKKVADTYKVELAPRYYEFLRRGEN